MKKPYLYNSVMILGPTASGKTSVAIDLAKLIDGEIISADSRQVYRKLDIGTGKDLHQYIENQVKYHLINITDIGSRYHINQYIIDFQKSWNEIQNKQVFPIICGGSGMYLDSMIKDYRFTNIPVNEDLRLVLANYTFNELINYFHQLPKTEFSSIADLSTVKRTIRAIEISTFLQSNVISQTKVTEVNPLIIGIEIDQKSRRELIHKRLNNRLNEGMVEEVQTLLNEGVEAEELIRLGLEYQYITWYLTGKLSYDEMVELLYIAICQFSKRQMTWFRKMEKEGALIHWLPYQLDRNKQLDFIQNLLYNINE